MKWSLFFLMFFCSLITLAQKEVNYKKISELQDGSVPPLDIQVDSRTRVLLVFPHADDEIVCGGLISWLNQKEADIHLMTLAHHPEQEDYETRMEELTCASEELGIREVETIGLINNSWDNVISDEIEFWYDHQDTIKWLIVEKIDRFKPEIIVTYDTEIGGYGHPEHRISAELTEAIFHEHRYEPSFPAHTILQITLPDKLEEYMIGKKQAYKLACKRTGSKGLPAPDAMLRIEDEWPRKNAAAQCYRSQYQTLKKFNMLYDPEQEVQHIKAFNREYYKVVKHAP